MFREALTKKVAVPVSAGLLSDTILYCVTTCENSFQQPLNRS